MIRIISTSISAAGGCIASRCIGGWFRFLFTTRSEMVAIS